MLEKQYPNRLNVPCTQEMKKFLEERSEETGLPMTAITRRLLNWAIKNYDVLKEIPDVELKY